MNFNIVILNYSNESVKWCFIEHNVDAFIWEEFCMLFMLPFLVIAICNACFMYKIAAAARSRSQISQVAKKINTSTAVTLFMISLVYMICTGGHATYAILLQTGVIKTHNKAVYTVWAILLPTNSAVKINRDRPALR